MTPTPAVLAPNTFDHFYVGGAQLAAFRGIEQASHRPEEWIGSTVTRHGHTTLGLTKIGDSYLRDLVASDPVGWLGADHVARFGPDTALLVKLLDPAERLPVHVHPTRRFASRFLGSRYGKTEAWVILGGVHGGGTVYLGTNRPVARDEWRELVETQATDRMLALLNPIDVEPGDTVLVPAGTPHAVDAGTFILEVQEPTDWSILLEWHGFDIDGRTEGHLGLGYDVAVDAVRTDGLNATQLATLCRRAPHGKLDVPVDVMPAGSEAFFRVWRLTGTGSRRVPKGFGVFVVTDGSGRLVYADGWIDVVRGTAVLLPHAVKCSLEGSAAGYLAQPPADDSPAPDS